MPSFPEAQRKFSSSNKSHSLVSGPWHILFLLHITLFLTAPHFLYQGCFTTFFHCWQALRSLYSCCFFRYKFCLSFSYGFSIPQMVIIDGSPFLYLRFFIYLCHPLKEDLELWLSFWLELVSGGIFVAALLSMMTLYLALAL